MMEVSNDLTTLTKLGRIQLGPCFCLRLCAAPVGVSNNQQQVGTVSIESEGPCAN